MKHNYWVQGGVRSGKTAALVDRVQQWWRDAPCKTGQSVLLFAMNSENRQQVTQRILVATDGTMPLRSTTPLGFFEAEVLLFWPLIAAQLKDNIAVPLRLRPESEQYLAVQVWGADQLIAFQDIERRSIERWARNLLDVLQLAAFAGVTLSQVPEYLRSREPSIPNALGARLGQMLQQWQDWCLSQGLLTYGLVSDLYWRCLLPLPAYQAQLTARYAYLLADDVENYPAIARHLFEHCDRHGICGVYTFNPDFSVRLGLGADPDYMQQLSDILECRVISLLSVDLAQGGSLWPLVKARWAGQDSEAEHLETIETVTRSQLLRTTAERVIHLVRSGVAQPGDIAIIGPGLDSLARYALLEIIEAQNIPVVSWKEQRPLNASALVRSLLTLLSLVYRGLGRFINQDDVAEMMAVLCAVDPVRAGLIADNCFKPDLVLPQLMSLEVFPRWDRVGHVAAQAYSQLCAWIYRQTSQPHLALIDCLSQAIAFFFAKRPLRFDENAVLRELLETAQHFSQVDEVLAVKKLGFEFNLRSVFVSVVRQGTMTANPYPANAERDGVVLATAYQYRIARLSHRYHFWLDINSSLWKHGSLIQLWGWESFLKLDTPKVSEDDAAIALLKDLADRTDEKLFLCLSELSIAGQEHIGVFQIPSF